MTDTTEMRIQLLHLTQGDVEKAKTLEEYVTGSSAKRSLTMTDKERADTAARAAEIKAGQDDVSSEQTDGLTEDEIKTGLIDQIKAMGGTATKKSKIETLEKKLQGLHAKQAQEEALDEAKGGKKDDVEDAEVISDEFSLKAVKKVNEDNIRAMCLELTDNHGWDTDDLKKIIKKGGAKKIEGLDEDGLAKVHKKLMKALKDA